MTKQEKLLLAIDGTEQSMDAVWYVSKFVPFHHMEINLLHIFSRVPESYRDLEKNPMYSKTVRNVMAWEAQQKKAIREYMNRAKNILVESGIPEDKIVVSIRTRKKGIARDIIKEARNGYRAVIIGRKSNADFQDIIMGSVAEKIVEKVTFNPVMIIGKIPPDEKVLIAVDGSKNSMRAVDFVAKILGGYPYDIFLLHVIRGIATAGIDRLFLSKDTIKEAENNMKSVFEEMKKQLVEVGFKNKRIKTKIIHGARSRAGAIVQEAKESNYGTIVVGRRGLSNIQSFFMGRVSNKVVHMTRNQAIWVVT